jgi:hypothetical protein
MNSLSRRKRWPWADPSGGASHPKRQRARLGIVGRHLARLTALALGIWLIWAPPSDASSASQLNPLTNSNIDIDWAPLETVFEILQAEFGIQEQVSPTRGLLGSAPAIKFLAQAKRRFSRSAVPTRVKFYDADGFPAGGSDLHCTPRLLIPIEVGTRLRCYFYFNPSTDPTAPRITRITFELPRSILAPLSSGPNASGGGLGVGNDCSRCEVYRMRESNCGRDCTFMNPYTPGASDAVDRCYDRAAECRTAAARAFEPCGSQCRS